MQSIGSYRAVAAGWAADECCFQRKRLNLAFAVKGIWKGDVVVCYVCVKGTDYAAAVKVYGEIFQLFVFYHFLFTRKRKWRKEKRA